MPARPESPDATPLGLPKIPRGKRLKGEKAEAFRDQVVKTYARASIRDICEETGRSYGSIHRLLKRSGVTFRPRGFQHTAAPGDRRDDE